MNSGGAAPDRRSPPVRNAAAGSKSNICRSLDANPVFFAYGNEHKVRAACHPHDPGVPPSGFQGVAQVLGTVEGLKRFVSLQESPYHGLNFCVGTVAEMLRDPGREIGDVIRYFGRRQKIFNIHFHNIRGHRDDFQEVYPDEGDLDLVEVAHVLQEVNYPYMVMPDHMPSHSNDPRGLQAFAYGYGYIKGVLQAVRKAAG